MTVIAPVPVLALSGADVASGPNPDGTLPSLLALDGASVRWGRAAVLDQPTPATATVELFDPAGTWAATADPLGKPVTLRWTVPGTTRTYFRGRVTGVQLEPRTAAGREGAAVTLTCSSVLTDLANKRPAAGAWPAETVAARRTRVAALAAGPVASVASRAAFDAAPLAPLDKPESSTVLDQMVGLFRATGADRYTYDPDTSAVGWLGRRSFAPATVAHLQRDSSRVGVYVAGPSVQRDAGSPVEPSVSVAAAVVGYTGGVSRSIESRLTRVTLSWKDPAASYAVKALPVLVPGADEAAVGVRSVDLPTDLAGLDPYALAAATDAAALVAGEASGWAIGAMRWDTGRTGGGFETLDQALLLLSGAERTGVFWLSGSWLPGLGILPCFGVMGGTITYRRGAWDVEWQPAPAATTAPVTGFSFDDLDPSIVWADGDDPNGFHSSVTLDDLAFVGSPTITTGA